MKGLKTQIIAKAQDLFIQYGFKKTTLTDIASALGKGKTAIYYYFENKEAIFSFIIKSEADKLLNAIIKKVESQQQKNLKMETYVHYRIALMAKTAAKYKIIKTELMQFLPLIEKIREPFHQKEIVFVEKLLDDLQQDKNYVIKSKKIAAITLVNTLKGLEIPMFVKDNFDMTEQSINELKQILLYGIIQKNNHS